MLNCRTVTRFMTGMAAMTTALMLSACASTSAEPVAATHYWESTVSTKKYNADNSACEQKTEVDADGQLDPSSASFSAYRDCMIEQGYTLRTY